MTVVQPLLTPVTPAQQFDGEGLVQPWTAFSMSQRKVVSTTQSGIDDCDD